MLGQEEALNLKHPSPAADSSTTLPTAILSSHARVLGPGREAPTFIAGVKALRADRVVADETQREGGGGADDGGWQLKAGEPERQRGAI